MEFQHLYQDEKKASMCSQIIQCNKLTMWWNLIQFLWPRKPYITNFI